ncbi:aldo/keto reductase [Pseudonocardia ailaonensis]|uniref:Aldo/keto reductase n=1 Tax=Pseudonocardia ailaonensis TaxID=367279 RepID=A0ABN2N632_9PSEU
MNTYTLAGRAVPRIGFGAMQLVGHRPVPRERAVAVLRRAVERGVTHIDTAEFYGDGAVNALIRDTLAPYPDELLLATKVGAVRSGGTLAAAQRPAELRAQVEANLASLSVERLGVVNVRRADAPPGIIATGEQQVPLDDQLAELITLRDNGKIGGIGLSNVDAAQLEGALPAGIACVQNSHSVLDRAAEPVLDLCRAHAIAWVPFCPLGSAFAGHPKVADDPVVREVAATLGATPAQVGLAWLLARYEGTLLIAGTTDPAHLDENLAAGDLVLDERSLARLDTLGAA